MDLVDGKIALVFPGQGCQYVGMGADLYKTFDESREIYDRADETLGYSLSSLCFEGPKETLDETTRTQPAIYTTTMALWRVLVSQLGDDMPPVSFVAGHSLGEFSALTVVGALTFEHGLSVVQRRGEAMRDCGQAHPGGMGVILGLDDETVQDIVATASDGKGIWIANLNCPGQVVVAGEEAALDRTLQLADERKAKRTLRLPVSVACHTPLMYSATELLQEALSLCRIAKPLAPVISNVTAEPTCDPDEIEQNLLRQLTSPVRWVESVRGMTREGVSTVIEIGPKSVLSGLIRRIDRSIKVHAITDAESLATFAREGVAV